MLGYQYITYKECILCILSVVVSLLTRCVDIIY